MRSHDMPPPTTHAVSWVQLLVMLLFLVGPVSQTVIHSIVATPKNKSLKREKLSWPLKWLKEINILLSLQFGFLLFLFLYRPSGTNNNANPTPTNTMDIQCANHRPGWRFVFKFPIKFTINWIFPRPPNDLYNESQLPSYLLPLLPSLLGWCNMSFISAVNIKPTIPGLCAKQPVSPLNLNCQQQLYVGRTEMTEMVRLYGYF